MSSFVIGMNEPAVNSIEDRPKKRKLFRWTTFLIHLVGITLLFLLPEVIVSLSENVSYPLPFSIYLKAIIYMGVFYVNFYWLVDELLTKTYRPMRFVMCNYVVIVIGTGLLILGWHEFGPGSKPPHSNEMSEVVVMTDNGEYKEFNEIKPPHGPGDLPAANIARDIIALFLTMALAVAIKLNFNRNKTEEERREMQALHREIELRQLRSQLSPHFLFNTLNSIYALVDIDQAKAKKAVHRLSRMLRYMLSDNRQPVTIYQELEFVRGYVELMKLRLAPTFAINVSLDCSSNPEAPIAPLIFINIIENAFKYGMTTTTDGNIEITIGLDGGKALSCISNTYDPEAAKLLHGRSSGIGLRNLKRRLELRYPSRHNLEVTDTGHEYIVRLDIDVIPNHEKENK